MEGFLLYIACPIDNRAPEALFTRGFRGHAPPENFLILGLQKWRFLDFEHKFSTTSALNVINISKGIINIASWQLKRRLRKLLIPTLQAPIYWRFV